MLATLRETLKAPEDGGLTSDGLVWRYNASDVDDVDDGVGGEEGAFNLCSFWLVEALAQAGRTDPALLEKAHLLFEKMLGHANHLGLFAEMTGLRGQALGNFPQAFSHLGRLQRGPRAGRRVLSPHPTGSVQTDFAGAPGATLTSSPGPTSAR